MSSVKANVGHLEGAAGIAGLTRVLLQLRHGQIAPCASLETVNPAIDLGPAYLPRSLAEWPRPAFAPRRAGVSSFGAGGSNVHLIVEEYPKAAPSGSVPGGERLFVLSARAPAQLAAYAIRVADFLDAEPETDLDGLCYTAQLGRSEQPRRLAILACTTADLAAKLRAVAAAGAAPGTVTGAVAVANGTSEVTAPARLGDAARAWAEGTRLDWRPLWPVRPRRVAFPGAPFDRARYWLDQPGTERSGPAAADRVAAEAAPRTASRPRAGSGNRSGSRGRHRPDSGRGRPRRGPGGAGPGRLVGAAARPDRGRGRPRRAVGRDGAGYLCLRPRQRRAMRPAGGAAGGPGQAAGRPGPGGRRAGRPAAGRAALARDCTLFVRLACAIVARGGALRAVSVTTGPASPARSADAGAIRTLALEHTRFSGSCVALAGDEDMAAAVAAELGCPDAGVMVRYREGRREVRELVRYEPPPDPGPAALVRAGGTYLITGGAGALGRHVAGLLAAGGPVRVVLAGRSAPTPDLLAGLEAWSRDGSTVVYHQADVTREADVAGLIRAHGPFRGVVHAAGVRLDRRAAGKTQAEMAQVLAPKVTGAHLLDEATRDHDLDFFVLFSSAAAEYGNPGQVDYAAAGAWLHAFAEQREARRRAGQRSGRTLAVAWPLWADGGMAVDDATRRLFARAYDMIPLPTQAGLTALRRSLAGDRAVVVVQSTTASIGAAGAAAAPAGAENWATAMNGAAMANEMVPAGETTALEDMLREQVAAQLRRIASGFLLVPEAEVDLARRLLDVGFDSISLTELINQVNDLYGLALLPTILFECVTLEAFSHVLASRYADEIRAAQPVPEMPVPARQASRPRPSAVSAPAPEPSAVAIVGMAGILPGSPDLDVFWKHLLAGDDLTGPAPADRLELHAHPDTAAIRAGFVSDVAGFDAKHFRDRPGRGGADGPAATALLARGVARDRGLRT